MRDKRRTRRRVAADGKAAAAGVGTDDARGVGTADWVLANEVGWGFPHSSVAILAGIIVGARAVARQVDRIAIAAGRAPRRRRD